MPETKKKETVMDALLKYRLASEQGFRAGVADILHMEGWDLKRGVQRASNREKSEREMAAELKQRIAERELKKASLSVALDKAREPTKAFRPEIMRIATYMEVTEGKGGLMAAVFRELEEGDMDSAMLADRICTEACELREALDNSDADAVKLFTARIALLATAAAEYARGGF